MKKIQTLILIALVLSACSLKQKGADGKNGEPGTTKQQSAICSPQELKALVSYLASDELKGRATGSKGIDKAANYIANFFSKHGVKPYFDSYKDPFDAKQDSAFNVVGFIEGSDPILKNEFVVLGAHYDHIGTARAIAGDSIANGANDNAAGTAAVMTMAKYFASTKKNKRSLIFALFDAEEIGLLGSKHLAAKLKAEALNLYTMLNFEMIGVPMKGKEYLAYLTGYDMSNLAHKMNTYAGAPLAGYFPKAKAYQLFYRSDNYPFFEAFNVPCQTLCTFDFTNFDHYHQVGDEVSSLDFNHMSYFVNAFIPAVVGVVNAPKNTIKLNKQ
jgi:aminopeptidase-like protein